MPLATTARTLLPEPESGHRPTPGSADKFQGLLGVRHLLTLFYRTHFHHSLADPSRGTLVILGDLHASRISAPFERSHRTRSHRFCSPLSTCKRTRILSRTSRREQPNISGNNRKFSQRFFSIRKRPCPCPTTPPSSAVLGRPDRSSIVQVPQLPTKQHLINLL